MNISRNLKVVIFSSLLVVVVGCGNNNKKSNNAQAQEPLCSTATCDKMNWNIALNGRSFPEKARVDINGEMVLNECYSKQQFAINRVSEPQSLTLENYYAPTANHVAVAIYDLGDCSTLTSVLDDSNVPVEIVKSGETPTLQINL